MEKDILGYEGLYFANDLGEIFSYPKKTRKGIRKIKCMPYPHGYLYVDLCKEGKTIKHLVHRLIAKTFIENPDNKPQVNHINGIKSDNRLQNLEWNTHSENQLHSLKIGLRSAKGEKNSQSKLNKDSVLLIYNDNRLYKYIAKDFNICISTVSSIKNNKSWSHLKAIKQNGKTVYI
jgi:hypothetical protein